MKPSLKEYILRLEIFCDTKLTNLSHLLCLRYKFSLIILNIEIGFKLVTLLLLPPPHRLEEIRFCCGFYVQVRFLTTFPNKPDKMVVESSIFNVALNMSRSQSGKCITTTHIIVNNTKRLD